MLSRQLDDDRSQYFSGTMQSSHSRLLMSCSNLFAGIQVEKGNRTDVAGKKTGVSMFWSWKWALR